MNMYDGFTDRTSAKATTSHGVATTSISAHHGRIIETERDFWFVSADRRLRFSLEDFSPDEVLLGVEVCLLREVRDDGWWDIHAIYPYHNGSNSAAFDERNLVRG